MTDRLTDSKGLYGQYMQTDQRTATIAVTLFLLFTLSRSLAADPELEQIKQIGARCTAAMTKAFSSSDTSELLQMTYPRVIEKGGGEAKMVEAIDQLAKAFKERNITWSVSSVEAPDRITQADGKFFALIPFTVELTAPKGHFRLAAHLLAVSEDQKKNWYLIDTSGLNNHPEYVKEWFPDGLGGLEIPPTASPVSIDGK
jgi:hypothetical protein